MRWQEYVKLSVRRRQRIKARALAGDEQALSTLYSVSNSITKTVNKRLWRLEKAGYDYGKNYNNLINYTNSNYGNKRLKTTKALKNDIHEIFDQTEAARAFLRGKGTTVRGAKKIEKYRITKWKELKIVPETFSRRDEEDFLRFLGNEAVTGAIDSYGRSDVIVEAIHDRYIDAKKHNEVNQVFAILELALTEFNDDKIKFDVAMERAGIKIENYRTKRATS